jgi:hypothetical protein
MMKNAEVGVDSMHGLTEEHSSYARASQAADAQKHAAEKCELQGIH